MELSALKNKVRQVCTGNVDSFFDNFGEEPAIYPFNKYETLFFSLIHAGHLSFEDYQKIRQEYLKHNPYLYVFEISAPRGFGEKFAQNYIHKLCPELQKPSKKSDPTYSGEYDFWLDNIKIEVKASRAVDRNSDAPLYMKALSTDTTSPFLMNFQQLKPLCCDVFVWMAVFRDDILLWVINSQTVLSHSLFSKGQHRGNHGNEGQLHITNENIQQFDSFLVKGNLLKAAILEAAN